MKNPALIFLLLLVVSIVKSQTVFTHATSSSNTAAHITTLDHPQLNNNPNAMVFVSPVWEQDGDANPVYAIGVWYNGSRWTIFNQNQYALPATASQRYRYKVLVFQNPPSNTFVHTVSRATITEAHITTLDHPQLNNNPNAIVLVTQRLGVYNDHEIGVSYDAGRWKVINQDQAPLADNTQFNVLVANNSIPNSVAFQHTHTAASQLAAPIIGYSALNNASINNNANWSLFVTQRYIGAYNPKTYNIWYDRPDDNYTYRNGSWLIYKSQNQEQMPLNAAFNVLAIAQETETTIPVLLNGWVDMHTHPMAKWGFGEQLFFGDVEGNPSVALGSCSCKHNFVAWPFDGNCGEQNLYRNNMVDNIDEKYGTPVHQKVAGFPNFDQWPKHNSVLHQQMWVEWIRRSYQGGLRVMVALAVNNHCLADAAETGGFNDDLRSTDNQIQKMIEFVGHHTDFMEIAYSAADLRRIVSANKLAIILGIESDNIGNFYNPADGKGGTYIPNPNITDVRREIDRLFIMGVRYIFPIHLTNNAFGGSAVYEHGFNIANKYNTGSAFDVEPVDSRTGITFKLKNPFEAIDDLGVLAMTFTGTILPGQIMPNNRANYPEYTDPGLLNGHRNVLGLNDLGKAAIRYMMQKSMLIDIDHSSENAVTDILSIADELKYPVNSGHNGPRGNNGNENNRTDEQYDSIIRLGGMVGLGHGGNTNGFLSAYRMVMSLTQGKQIAIGTDANGLFPLPGPPTSNARITYGGALTQCVMGSKTWDYNTEGVAHYGLMPDYIKSWEAAGMTATEKDVFFKSAEYFTQMWERCERQSANVRN